MLSTTRGADAEWRLLRSELAAAFAESAAVSAEHPCASCLEHCQWGRLLREVRGQGRWEDGCYTRTTLLHEDEFVCLLLCWSPGVSSPVHAHSDAETKVKSNCFMLVLEGELVETLYEPCSIIATDKVDATAGHSRSLTAGSTAYINDNIGLHRVANASATQGAISLHVYAPGWRSVQTYEETTPTDASGAPIDVDGWGDF